MLHKQPSTVEFGYNKCILLVSARWAYMGADCALEP